MRQWLWRNSTRICWKSSKHLTLLTQSTEELQKKEGSESSTREPGYANSVLPSNTTFGLSIADVIQIVNTTHQSILSDDVLKALGETRNPEGHYAKRVKFSLSQQTDEGYNLAVRSGDTEKAQEMVEATAKKAGYTIHAYHGTARADRVGTEFREDRATSGPMASIDRYSYQGKSMTENSEIYRRAKQ